MKVLLCAAALAVTGAQADAQFFAAWQQAYDDPSHGQDRSHAVTVDRMGNTYVAGQSARGLSGIDYVIVKYSPTGAQLWQAPFAGISNGTDIPRSIAFDEGSGAVYWPASLKLGPLVKWAIATS